MHKTLLLIAGGLASAACAQTTAPAPGPSAPAEPGTAECRVEPAQQFVGQKATAETGERLIEATGARQLRWVPPRTAVTMDFRPDRLTVSYDDDMVITQVSCS